MEKLSGFASIVSEAQRGELVFPTSVNAALALQLALSDPDCHDEEVIRLVLAEPVLAARAVALANAAVFRNQGGVAVTSARSAVTRLGYRNLYSLAAAMVVRHFGSRIEDPVLRHSAEQLWKYTAHVAALAYQIAARITRCDPDTALFAGIVHEVGGFYLLARADAVRGLLDDPEQWLGAVPQLVTQTVLQRLQVPEPVSAVIVSLYSGAVGFPPTGLRDTLLLARHLCPVLSPLPAPDEAELLRSGALARYLDDYPAIAALLDDAAEDARAMSAALLV